MRGLKYLFNNLRHWQMVVLIVFAVLLVFPFVFHEELGNEDYIYPKAFLCFDSIFFTAIFVTIGCRDISRNKLVPSYPIARELYTKSIPAFIVIFTVLPITVLLAAYFVFLASVGAEEAQYSDTLVCAGIMCGSLLIAMPPLVKNPVGGVLSLYISAIPISGAVMLTKNSRADGFGLPIWLAAVIAAAALVIGAIWAFLISGVMYRRRKVKNRLEVRI